MKKLFLVWMICFFIAGNALGNELIDIGVIAGGNITDVDAVGTYAEPGTDTGYNVGVFVNINVTDVCYLRTEFMYGEKNFEMQLHDYETKFDMYWRKVYHPTNRMHEREDWRDEVEFKDYDPDDIDDGIQLDVEFEFVSFNVLMGIEVIENWNILLGGYYTSYTGVKYMPDPDHKDYGAIIGTEFLIGNFGVELRGNWGMRGLYHTADMKIMSADLMFTFKFF